MTRFDRITLVAFVLLAVLIGYLVVKVDSAEAINRDQLPAMHQVAVDHFGPVPCGEVAYEFVPAAALAGDDAPNGARARGGNCRTQLAEEIYDAATWAEACEDVVHEYGHSLRDDWDPVAPDIQDHSPDKNSIMYHDDTNHTFAPCAQANPNRALEQRCDRATDRRYRASDRTIDARRKLRRLIARHAQTDRVYRAHRQVRKWRKAYETARSQHRSCLAELRTYGVEV